MAYVDVAQQPHESLNDCRLRRRKELARGWRFACTCHRCLQEGPQTSSAVEKNSADESKIEDVVHRYEKSKEGPLPEKEV